MASRALSPRVTLLLAAAALVACAGGAGSAAGDADSSSESPDASLSADASVSLGADGSVVDGMGVADRALDTGAPDSAGDAGAGSVSSTPFAGSFWTTPLEAGTPLASDAGLVGVLAANARSGAGLNVTVWNARIYVVPVGQPPVKVVVNGTSQSDGLLQAALDHDNGVPFPEGAMPSSVPYPDTDSEISVYQPDWTDGADAGTGRLWEFWHASSPAQNAPDAGPLPWGTPSYADSQWHVDWGGRVTYVSSNPGHPVDRYRGGTLAEETAAANSQDGYESKSWLATATSLPLLAGEVTFQDWASGHIRHAVGLALTSTCAKYVWPAQRADGSPDAGVPEGTRLRLPASFVVDPSAPKLLQMIEEAVRDYGFVVWDTSGGVSLRFEQQQQGDPHSTCPGPACSNEWLQPPGSGSAGAGAFYDGDGGYVSPSNMAARFPWSSLQVIQPGSDLDPN